MHLKQQTPFGCGLYAVANALEIPNFVTPERLAESSIGNTNGQLGIWLQQDGYQAAIDYLYYNHKGVKLPASALTYTASQCEYLPLVFNIRYVKGGKNHLIAGKLYPDGKLLIVDSLKPEIIETKLSKINNLYAVVYGMGIFMDSKTGDYLFIQRKQECEA